MEILKLKGGRTIGATPVEVQKAAFKVGTPGTLFCTIPTGDQLAEAARRQYGMPEVNFVKVLFREIDGVLYLTLAPYRVEGGEPLPTQRKSRLSKKEQAAVPPDVYKKGMSSKAPVVYGLKRLFKAIGYTLRPDSWFVMDSILAEDEKLGYVVVGDWTHARVEPREVVKKSEDNGKAKTDTKKEDAEAKTTK